MTENPIQLLKEIQSFATLEDVHNAFKKWFHLQDTNRIDVVLATAISLKMDGTSLWLIVVAPSGDMKSEQIGALDDDGETAKRIHKMTDKTLVNGYKDKSEYPDLAPKLDGKIMLITDMAEILQLHHEVKASVWAQLRELYDGNAGSATGMGTDIEYKNLRVTLIAGSTPAIDDQILIHQSLGTRELIYRPKEIVDVPTLMKKVWKNEETEAIMHEEIRKVSQNFVRSTEIKDIQIPEQAEKKIMKYAQWLCDMRATAPTDSYSGELRGDVYPEMPTRILKQLKRYFICLKSLSEDYTDEKALQIIKEIVESSADQTRIDVLKLLSNGNTFTTSEVANALRIGKKTAKTELNILWNLDRVERKEIEGITSYGNSFIQREEWTIKPSPNGIENT